MIRLRHALQMFERDKSEYPQGGVYPGFWTQVYKAKAALCILLGRLESGADAEVITVHIGPLSSGWDWNGAYANWLETGVKPGWRDWHCYEFSNGI